MNNILAYMMVLICRGNFVNLTKLNKLIFFCDIIYFIKNGKTISKEIYLKLPRGPVAKHANNTRYTLIANDILKEKEIKHSFYMEHKYKSNNKMKFDIIKEALDKNNSGASEIISNVITNLKEYKAGELSDITHKYEPWKSAKVWGEELELKLVKDDQDFKTWLSKNRLL